MTDSLAPAYDRANGDELLRGAYEMHAHSAPDVAPRSLDDIQLVTQARDAGMAGVVLKCHQSPTCGRAYVLERLIPGIRVFGSVCLNSYTGGLNPEAAEVAIKMGGRVVWLPTISASNHQLRAEQKPGLKHIGGGTTRPGITILDEQGRLKPEVMEICNLVRESNVILSTGHLSARETVVVSREARRLGVGKVLVSHPDIPMINVPVEEQRELAALGCYFDRCYAGITSRIDPIALDALVANIRQVGVESTVLTSDYGQVHNPPPIKGLRQFIGSLLQLGITEREIEVMVKTTPARLLL